VFLTQLYSLKIIGDIMSKIIENAYAFSGNCWLKNSWL
jgi:hypothetical protein